jgi:DNA-binding NarL/FixJ family response regulator
MASRPTGLAYFCVSSTLDRAQRISSPIRIVVGQVPRLLRDIIADAVAHEADMMLVEVGGVDLATLVKKSGADVAILADGLPDRGARHRQVLVEHPNVKIFVVADNGRDAQLLEFQQRLMPDVSPEALVRAIREAVGR